MKIFMPHQESMYFIAYASSKDPDKPAQMCSFARALAAHIHQEGTKTMGQVTH